MLAPEHRLRRRGEFVAAVRGGRRFSRGAVVVHISVGSSPIAPDRPARAGFVVPRAVGGAVVRNTVRRRLRHLVREHVARLPAGTDVVVRALPGAGERTYVQLASDLGAALSAASGSRAGRGKRTATRAPGSERGS